MRKLILAGLLASVAFSASAQNATSPIGKWKTLDDKSGKPMTITEVYESQAAYDLAQARARERDILVDRVAA